MRRIYIFIIVFVIFISYKGNVYGQEKIPYDVITGLNYIIDKEIGKKDTGFGKLANYTRDRNNSTLKINIPNLRDSNIQVYNNQINIDLYNVRANLSDILDIDKLINDRLINSFVFNKSTLEINITLRDNVDFTYNINENDIIFRFNKKQSLQPKIVIDAGHGGKDAGATSIVTKVHEKELALKTSLNLKDKLLDLGYEVLMTREEDIYPTLKDRAKLANDADADLFISIHYNTAPRSEVNGIETYVYMSNDNKNIGEKIHTSLINKTGAFNRGLKNGNKLIVLNSTNVPAVLLELGFLTNTEEANKVLDEFYQEDLVNAIIEGINSYFGR